MFERLAGSISLDMRSRDWYSIVPSSVLRVPRRYGIPFIIGLEKGLPGSGLAGRCSRP